MGKKSPKIADPVSQINKVFPGLQTGAFSLQRATPSQTFTSIPAASGAFPQFSLEGVGGARADELSRLNARNAQISGAFPSTTTTGGSGPFVLQRTDRTVPNLERQIFGSLLANQQAIAGLNANESINIVRSGIPRLLAGSAEARTQLEQLLPQVEPGFGRLTQSVVEGIRNRAGATVGNLRESLAQRNLLGSSFANQSIAQVQRDFSEQEEQARSEAFLQELDQRRQVISDIGKFRQLDQGTLQLSLGLNAQEAQNLALELSNIQQQGVQLAQLITRELEELRIAGGIVTGVSQTAAALASAQAQLQAQAAQAAGEGFGTLLGIGASLALAPATGGGSLFGNLFSAGAGAAVGTGLGASASPTFGVF